MENTTAPITELRKRTAPTDRSKLRTMAKRRMGAEYCIAADAVARTVTYK